MTTALSQLNEVHFENPICDPASNEIYHTGVVHKKYDIIHIINIIYNIYNYYTQKKSQLTYPHSANGPSITGWFLSQLSLVLLSRQWCSSICDSNAHSAHDSDKVKSWNVSPGGSLHHPTPEARRKKHVLG